MIPLPHRLRIETFIILNLVGCKYILYHVCVDKSLSRLDNPTRIWKLKLENKDILFVAFQQKKIQSLWVLIYSVLLLTLFSGNSWNTWWDLRHVRASLWCHILTLVIVFFLLFINSEELIYFQISEVPYLNSQTQFIITLLLKFVL